MKDNVVKRKSFDFALGIVTLCTKLSHDRKEYVLSRQLLRSGTSIGANIEEAVGAYSKKEFISKIAIAYKEARESGYWLNILFKSKTITETEYKSLYNQLEEILKLLTSILNTAKKNGGG